MQGIIVEYTKTDGTQQKAMVHDKDQTPAIKNLNRLLILLLNDDFTTMRNEKGRGILALKSKTELKRIGYVD